MGSPPTSPSALRALFAPGTPAGASAQSVFTNRVSELDAFQRSLASLAATDVRAADLGTPRRNLLVFYGSGGIGKSALSRHLERSLDQWVCQETGRKCLSARIDLEDVASRDMERIVLHLRAAFAKGATKWSAFDLVFQTYWARAHPGRPLDDFLRGDSTLGRLADRVGLSEHMQAAFEDVSSSMLKSSSAGIAAHQLIAATYNRARKAAAHSSLSERCPFFTPLLEAEPAERTLPFFGSLLAWDLLDAPSQDGQLPVVFLDTFEAIQGTDREAMVQRLIFLMPNVLFVVTGRSRLDWTDPAPCAQLDYPGEALWPHLTVAHRGDEPRQHALGYLSAHDCQRFLESALVHNGLPAIPAEIRRRICRGSEGLPLYLDLSVAQFLAASQRGGELDADRFGVPLAAVISQTMRDLDSEERAVLRGAALLGSFDFELAAAAGGVGDAATRRLLTRTFIERDEGSTLPFRMHASLRSGIRDVDRHLPDGWSDREWDQAAQRILSAVELAWHDRDRGERDVMLRLLGEAMRAALECGTMPVWLRTAYRELTDSGNWLALALLPEPKDCEDDAAGWAVGLRGIAARRLSSLDEADEHLARAAGTVSLAEDREFFLLHRAHAVRNRGQYRQAGAVYRSLRSSTRRATAERAAYQLADLALLSGDFAATQHEVAAIDPHHPEMEVEVLRLQGHVLRFQGDLNGADERYAAALEVAERDCGASAVAKVLVNLAECEMWRRPSRTATLDRAWTAAREVGNHLDQIKLCAAEVVMREGEEVWTDRGLELTSSTHYAAGAVFVRLAQCCAAMRRGVRDLASEARHAAAAATDTIGAYDFTLVLFDAMMNEPDATRPVASYKWTLPPDGVVAAWRNLARAA